MTEQDITISATPVVIDQAAIVEAAVIPWRDRARKAEASLRNLGRDLIAFYRENNIDALQSREQLNELLSSYGLDTVRRTISGSVEVTVTATFTFEELELEEGEDVEDKVREWLQDEGHVDGYTWDFDSVEVDAEDDE